MMGEGEFDIGILEQIEVASDEGNLEFVESLINDQSTQLEDQLYVDFRYLEDRENLEEFKKDLKEGNLDNLFKKFLYDGLSEDVQKELKPLIIELAEKRIEETSKLIKQREHEKQVAQEISDIVFSENYSHEEKADEVKRLLEEHQDDPYYKEVLQEYIYNEAMLFHRDIISAFEEKGMVLPEDRLMEAIESIEQNPGGVLKFADQESKTELQKKFKEMVEELKEERNFGQRIEANEMVAFLRGGLSIKEKIHQSIAESRKAPSKDIPDPSTTTPATTTPATATPAATQQLGFDENIPDPSAPTPAATQQSGFDENIPDPSTTTPAATQQSGFDENIPDHSTGVSPNTPEPDQSSRQKSGYKKP